MIVYSPYITARCCDTYNIMLLTKATIVYHIKHVAYLSLLYSHQPSTRLPSARHMRNLNTAKQNCKWWENTPILIALPVLGNSILSMLMEIRSCTDTAKSPGILYTYLTSQHMLTLGTVKYNFYMYSIYICHMYVKDACLRS